MYLSGWNLICTSSVHSSIGGIYIIIIYLERRALLILICSTLFWVLSCIKWYPWDFVLVCSNMYMWCVLLTQCVWVGVFSCLLGCWLFWGIPDPESSLHSEESHQLGLYNTTHSHQKAEFNTNSSCVSFRIKWQGSDVCIRLAVWVGRIVIATALSVICSSDWGAFLHGCFET